MLNKFITSAKDHPKNFSVFIELLVEEFAPLHIYQFASWEQTNKIESVFCPKNEERQQLCFLFILLDGNRLAEHVFQDFVDQHYREAKVIIYTHEMETLKKNMGVSHVFYLSVLAYGQIIYSKDGALEMLTAKTPNYKKWLGRAIVDWRHRKKMASGFFNAAEQAMEFEHEQVTLFLLHHSIIEASIGLIYVFMGYHPIDCRLKKMLCGCSCFSILPYQHFFGTKENEAMVEILIKCCSRAGYSADSRLGSRSIYRFIELVESYLALADQLCTTQFSTLEKVISKIGTGLPQEISD